MADKENGADKENDTKDKTPAAGEDKAIEQQPQVRMNVLTQFIRDMSFENILAQKGTGGDVQPDITVSVNLDAKKRAPEHQYEVALKINVHSKNKENGDSMFVLEMDYVGVFHIEGIKDDQLHPFLMIECPRMIFPFVRRIVSDVTRDGGFPPLNLETIDFMQLYRGEIARRQAESAKEKKPDA